MSTFLNSFQLKQVVCFLELHDLEKDLKVYHMSVVKTKNTENHTINSALIPLKKCFVGMTGFEPATTRPPAECATGLRYIPNSDCKNIKVEQM